MIFLRRFMTLFSSWNTSFGSHILCFIPVYKQLYFSRKYFHKVQILPLTRFYSPWAYWLNSFFICLGRINSMSLCITPLSIFISFSHTSFLSISLSLSLSLSLSRSLSLSLSMSLSVSLSMSSSCHVICMHQFAVQVCDSFSCPLISYIGLHIHCFAHACRTLSKISTLVILLLNI